VVYGMSRYDDLRAMREAQAARAEAFVRSALTHIGGEPPSERTVRAVTKKVISVTPALNVTSVVDRPAIIVTSKRGRGRPKTGKAMSGADRVRAYRERRAKHA
jgi:hypothetical protein